MNPQNPNFEIKTREIFSKAPFIQHLEINLEKCEPGFCTSRLKIKPEHLQQNNFIHAAVLTAIADHTAGACAGTLIKESETILSSEFHVHLLRPGTEKEIECHSKILKAGTRLVIVESEVYGIPSQKLIIKASVTLAVVEPLRPDKPSNYLQATSSLLPR